MIDIAIAMEIMEKLPLSCTVKGTRKKKSSDITQKTALLMLVRNPLENSFQMWIEKT